MTLAEAVAHLGGVIELSGDLSSVGKSFSRFSDRYLGFYVGDEEVSLDGMFTADDLEAVAIYMRGRDEDAS